MHDIRIIPSSAIDAVKLNDCVAILHGLIYSRTEYLDALCDNWSGLVAGDYATVMALPWRKKAGIQYFYEPPFVQQLGLIGVQADMNEVLQQVFNFARYGDILFNYTNAFIQQQLPLTSRTNLVIDLSAGYENVASAYKKDLVLNLKKAAKENLIYEVENDTTKAIDLYKQNYEDRMPGVQSQDYDHFKTICVLLQQQGMCLVRKIMDGKGELLSVALLLKDDHRLYNLMNTTTDAGRKTEANHYLLDAILKEFAGSNLVFDFEGSDLPGVKNFYQKFGATDQPYFHYHHNELPAIIKWLKP